VTLEFVAVTDLKGYAMSPIVFADGSDGLRLRCVQKDAEQMTAVDLEVGMADAGLD
jgi:hypothetical protein